MARQQLLLFSPWFGPWPEWINFTFESCRHNPEITWLIPTDQTAPENLPPNVHLLQMSLADFLGRMSAITGLHLAPENIYKICDFKPLFAEAFSEHLSGFSHFGYTDLDVIYGQLSCELTPERLNTFEIISSHGFLQAGHLSVFRNTERLRRAWRHVPGWRRALAAPEHRNFDEGMFGKRLDPKKWHLPWRRYRVLWQEMYSTPDWPFPWLDGAANSPDHWTWHNGVLTNTQNGPREFAYLHFMNWRSDRYRYGPAPAPWPDQPNLLHIDWAEAAQHGFAITHKGFCRAELTTSRTNPGNNQTL